MMKNYICLDLETTGLDPQLCDVIEIAMIRVRDGEIVDRYESFVYTPLEISQHVSYLTGISAADIKDAPDFRDIAEEVAAFIGDDPLVGHNIWFDWNFLMEKGIDLKQNALWDTYILSTILYPELPSHSLETNTKYFDIAHEDSHRAMADVIASHELWLILMETFPMISDEQQQRLQDLKAKTDWPLLDYFLQERPAHKHDLKLDEAQQYQPQSVDLPERDSDQHLFVSAPGSEPVDLAVALPRTGKTLIIAGYEHTQQKLHQAIPESVRILPPYEYLSPDRIESLWQKERLEDAEATLLLKHVLNPAALTRKDLVLSHPEKMMWSEVQVQMHDSEENNPAAAARDKAHQSSVVISSHFHLLKHLDTLDAFDQLVILDPQLLEENATRSFGQQMTVEAWERQSTDEQWRAFGSQLFETITRIGQQIVPASQYPEHIRLTDVIIQSNEFIRMATQLKEFLEEPAAQEQASFLKYYQAFFLSQDPSWVRWITVDPRRGVSCSVAPLDVHGLLHKHLFERAQTTVISDTVNQLSWMPEEHDQMSLPRPFPIQVLLPEKHLLKGMGKHGDLEAQMSYLASRLPELSGKTAVVFSSKTQLKRVFFDVAKTLPEDLLALAEDISGGVGKLRDRYVNADQANKVLFISYRSLRMYARQLMDFDQILLQSVPFDPPGYPVNQARSELSNNAFMEFALPAAQQNLLGIVNTLSFREGNRVLEVIDLRVQEKRYGQELLDVL